MIPGTGCCSNLLHGVGTTEVKSENWTRNFYCFYDSLYNESTTLVIKLLARLVVNC